MKKLLVLIPIVLLCITGCKVNVTVNGKNVLDNSKKVVCTLNKKESNVTLTGTYTIKYNDEFVSKVEVKEEYVSSDKSILDSFAESINENYEEFNSEYGGYTYNITETPDKLVVETTLDYDAMDIKNYLKDYPDAKSYINGDNKVTLSGIKNVYTSLGATCE